LPVRPVPIVPEPGLACPGVTGRDVVAGRPRGSLPLPVIRLPASLPGLVRPAARRTSDARSLWVPRILSRPLAWCLLPDQWPSSWVSGCAKASRSGTFSTHVTTFRIPLRCSAHSAGLPCPPGPGCRRGRDLPLAPPGRRSRRQARGAGAVPGWPGAGGRAGPAAAPAATSASCPRPSPRGPFFGGTPAARGPDNPRGPRSCHNATARRRRQRGDILCQPSGPMIWNHLIVWLREVRLQVL
jgi:hypothetical protein